MTILTQYKTQFSEIVRLTGATAPVGLFAVAAAPGRVTIPPEIERQVCGVHTATMSRRIHKELATGSFAKQIVPSADDEERT